MSSEADPPKLSTVQDFESINLLEKALKHSKLEDWHCPVWSKKSTADMNDASTEARRLMVLKSYNVLDSETDDPEFDELTKHAKNFFDVPVAVITLVDIGRQWFKSCQGFPATETPRCVSFCQHVVKRKERFGPMIIEDATMDPRFRENPLVAGEPNVRFYAGAPLRTPEGEILGSFCILDFKPRKLTQTQSRRLEMLAQETVFLLISRSNDSNRRASA